jgi:hypothetical protein
MSTKEEIENNIKEISRGIQEKLYALRSVGLQSRTESSDSPLRLLDKQLDELISRQSITSTDSTNIAIAELISETKENLAISAISEFFNAQNHDANLLFSAKMLEAKVSRSIVGITKPAEILPVDDPKTDAPNSTDLLLAALLNAALAEREHINGNHELSQFYLINAIASQNTYAQIQQESSVLSSRAAKGAEAKHAQLRDLMDKIFTVLGDGFIKNNDTKSIIEAIDNLPTQEFASEINKNYPSYKTSKCPESRSLAKRIELKKKELESGEAEK